MVENSKFAKLFDLITPLYKEDRKTDPSKMFIDTLVWAIVGLLSMGMSRDFLDRLIKQAADRIQENLKKEQLPS